MEDKSIIKADVKKNRLYLKLSGSYTIEDAIPIINRINHEVVKLKPGFGVISDIIELGSVDIKAAFSIKKGTGIIIDNGAKHLVRVVGNSKMALKLFAKFANLTSRVKISYVPTMEKAEELLNEENL